MAGPDIPLGGGGGHAMMLNPKRTVESFGRRKLIYNKIITHTIYPPAPLDSLMAICNKDLKHQNTDRILNRRSF